MWHDSKRAGWGVDAIQWLGNKPVHSIIVIADEIIIICDSLLISETMEKAADKHHQGN